MNSLTIEIDAISNLALQITKTVLAENDETQKIAEDDSGPLALASALSDFFQIASALENNAQHLDSEQLSEFGEYGLDLLDRLAYQTRQLDIVKHRDDLSRVYPSLAVWLARQKAVLDNLEGTANGFALVANGLTEQDELADLCRLIEEVLEASSEQHKMDEDKNNQWRPWRILNLNSGIVATRSLNPQLMETVFEKLGQRLPNEMSNFFNDGLRQMSTQNIPDEVHAIMKRYADQWSATQIH